MNRKRRNNKKQPLFDPDNISAEISQALQLDLGKVEQVYDLPHPLTFAKKRQSAEILKKYCATTQDKELLERQTFKTFDAINCSMQSVNVGLLNELPHAEARIQSTSSYMDKVHLRARALAHFVLGSFSTDEWFTECKNSGGSSIGVPFSDTSQKRKFTYPISATMRVQPLFDAYLAFDFQLRDAIQNLNSDYHLGDKYKTEEGSRATTVDKTTTKRRMICVEPTANMFLQQGLMTMMYGRLAKVGLDVTSLPALHKELARVGSITGNLATIDFTSASDCVSIELLRWILPPKWFRVIESVRSPSASFYGEHKELHMISTMGNATTFPLETLVFWTYAHAVLLSLRPGNSLFPEWEDLNCISVFGDDCIVPTSAAVPFMDCMESIGFVVNKEKSFYGAERFRESCGGDYLAGYDVRPFNLRAPHSRKMSALEPWLYIIFNGLITRYTMYFGSLTYVYDKELWRLLFSYFTKYKISIKLVPSYFPDDAGLKVSHDIQRFLNHYTFHLDRIDKSEHGTYMFRYCRFQYRQKIEKYAAIELASWLKRPTVTTPFCPAEEPDSFTPLRRIGGYVVAKGLSCHWHVPRVERGGERPVPLDDKLI